MEKEKLKPCPFCGGKHIRLTEGVKSKEINFCECVDCRMDGPMSNTPKDAVTLWNIRNE